MADLVKVGTNPDDGTGDTIRDAFIAINTKLVDFMGGVKVYRALLTQTGTDAPVATVLENSIGAVVWTYDSLGTYFATLTGAFPQNKTFFTSPNSIGILLPPVEFCWRSLDSMEVYGQDDGQLVYWPVEILVYP